MFIVYRMIENIILRKIRTIFNGFFCKYRGNWKLTCTSLPGNAQSIGAILDQIDWDEVLGTICGDDTCLLICRNEEASEEIKLEF